MAQSFEIWESPDGGVRFCFSHSDKQFTTGVLIIKPNVEIPKHNRPLAVENLLQVAGTCTMTLLGENDEIESVHELGPGNNLRMDRGQWHIHANTGEEESVTLFKAEGDITEVISELKKSFNPIILE
jgi:quercetin dioxygenase-like cupin family protein